MGTACQGFRLGAWGVAMRDIASRLATRPKALASRRCGRPCDPSEGVGRPCRWGCIACCHPPARRAAGTIHTGQYHRSLVLAELFPAPAFALLPVTYAVRLRLAPFPALARRPERRFVVAVEHIEITRHTVQKHRLDAVDRHHDIGAVLVRRRIRGFAGQINRLACGIAVTWTAMRQKGKSRESNPKI